MSLSDLARAAGAMAVAASLGGCFQPLYGEAAHPGLVADMQAIEIGEINLPKPGGKPNALGLNPEIDREDRLGHYLRNDLIFNFNGTGTTPPPKYRLTVTTSESTTTPTVQSQIGAADAATLTATAKFVLIPVGGSQPIIAAEAVSSAVYDLSINRFSNLRAARDAEIRLAKSLADEMELRIAAALAANKGS